MKFCRQNIYAHMKVSLDKLPRVLKVKIVTIVLSGADGATAIIHWLGGLSRVFVNYKEVRTVLILMVHWKAVLKMSWTFCILR